VNTNKVKFFKEKFNLILQTVLKVVFRLLAKHLRIPPQKKEEMTVQWIKRQYRLLLEKTIPPFRSNKFNYLGYRQSHLYSA